MIFISLIKWINVYLHTFWCTSQWFYALKIRNLISKFDLAFNIQHELSSYDYFTSNFILSCLPRRDKWAKIKKARLLNLYRATAPIPDVPIPGQIWLSKTAIQSKSINFQPLMVVWQLATSMETNIKRRSYTNCAAPPSRQSRHPRDPRDSRFKSYRGCQFLYTYGEFPV